MAPETDKLERLRAQWLGKIEIFDQDLRHHLRAAAPRPAEPRPGITVISLILPGSLPTLSAWLQVTKATLGERDTWLVVNAGADATSQAYAAYVAEQAGACWLEAPQDASEAWQTALAKVRSEFVACVAPNFLPSWHWLERASTHLLADPSLGLVAASLPPFGTTGPPLDALDLSLMEHGLLDVVSGQREATGVLETLCFVARAECLRRNSLCITQSHGFANQLAQQGFAMATAHDVWARRLDMSARPAHVLEGTRQVLLAQAANLQPAADSRKISIVVPVLNQAPLTEAFLKSLYAHTSQTIELIVVDNGSGPEVAEVAHAFARQYGNLEYVRNERNEGFAYACNQGLCRSQGAYVVVINNDTQVPPGWLSRLLAVFDSDPNVGIVGPMTNRCVGLQQIQPAPYADVSQFASAAVARTLSHRGGSLNVGRLVGLCLVIKADVIARIGGFDTAFGYGNFEDDDFCLRARRAGFGLAVAEDVLLHHEGSATFTGAGFDARALAQQNWEIFCHKWHHDPSANRFTQIEALASAQAFDPSTDLIPPAFSQQFPANAPPLPLDSDKPFRLLMVPDLDNAAWLAALKVYLETFRASSPVVLVLRPHPPTPERTQAMVQQATDLLNRAPDPAHAPQVILEASWLPPGAQARLYAAMSAWIRTPGAYEPFVARECAAMGLPELAATAEAFRSFVDARQVSSSATPGAMQ